MKKRFKWMGGLGAIAFAALQFSNPPRQNPPVQPGHDLLASNAPPPAVAAILRNSCYDCHSYETTWPWYSRVAPVSWWVASDINAARGAMNLSEWPHGEAVRARKRWRHIADEIQSGDMPPANYAWMHPRARLDAQQRAELLKWAQGQSGD